MKKRHPPPEKQERHYKATHWLSSAELVELQALARHWGRSLSDTMRWAVKECLKKESER
jgi:hypothetical protein